MIDSHAYMEGIYRNDYGMSGVPRPPRRRFRPDTTHSDRAETAILKRKRFRLKKSRYSTGRRMAWRLMRLVGPAVAGASAFMFVLAGT